MLALKAYWPMVRSSALFAAILLVAAIGCGPSGNKPGEGKPGETKTGDHKAGETKRIIFLTNGADPFWDALDQGLKDGAKEYDLAGANLKVERDLNSGGDEGQIERLRQYATQPDIAAVAISVIKFDNRTIVEEMRNLQKKGVKVITVDGEVDRANYRDARSFYIGTENVTGGKVLGTALKGLLAAKNLKEGGYVQFAGYLTNDNAKSRMDGVETVLKAGGFTQRDRMEDKMNLRDARDNVRNACTNHPDLVALVGIWAYNAPAIAEVVTERTAREKYLVGTFDAQEQAIDHMVAGKIDVMVVQNPFDMGKQSVRLCKAMIQNDEKTIKEMFPNQGKPDGDIYTTGLRVVVPSADSAVKKELFESFGAGAVEFMVLPDFQAWLKKYGLKSS